MNLDEIPHPEIISLYAQLISELMFIAIDTQPLIAQPVNALAHFMTTANSELYVLAKECCATLKESSLGKSLGLGRCSREYAPVVGIRF